MNVTQQRKQAAKTQRLWARLAFRDEKYNNVQKTRDITQGNFTLARLHGREAKVAHRWGMKRLRWASKY
jgi:hypothetical protein